MAFPGAHNPGLGSKTGETKAAQLEGVTLEDWVKRLEQSRERKQETRKEPGDKFVGIL